MALAVTFQDRVKKLFLHDIWETELTSLTSARGFVVRLLRVLQLAVGGFVEDQCLLHASALTYGTLMALVPILAIVFSVLKGLGAAQEVLVKLEGFLVNMPQQFQGFIDNLLHSVTTANVAAVGWIGVVALLVTVVQVISSIEWSFNQVWGIKTSRNVLRRIANYISTVVVVPILIMAALAISASLTSEAFINRLGLAASFYRRFLTLAPYLATWLAFSFLYVFVPNTRVQATPALVSGLIGSLLWLGWQKLYVILQIHVSRYNVLYGGFLAVPIFLTWLYFSWAIVLLGVEIAFGMQNHETYELERTAGTASVRSKLVLMLLIVTHAARGLMSGQPLFDSARFARERHVPIRLVNELIRLLVHHGLLAETAEHEGTYALLRTPDNIRVYELVQMIMQDGTHPERLGLGQPDPEVSKVLAIFEKMTSGMDQVTMQDVLQSDKLDALT
jgi:membrane protein